MKYEFKENIFIQLAYRLMNSDDLNTKTTCHTGNNMPLLPQFIISHFIFILQN